MTEAADLLIGYLVSLKADRALIISIVGSLPEGEAEMEMLKYIAETKETNLVELAKTASKISQKYPEEEETDD